MVSYKIIKYSPFYKSLWNDFNEICHNSSFLFNRNYIEYHYDKFQDYSLLIFDNEELKAILPGNIVNNSYYSHQGLTYGGLAYNKETKLLDIIRIFYHILKYLHQQNINLIYYKCLPKIYNLLPSDEMDWVLFKLSAVSYRRDCSLSILNSNPVPFQNRRLRLIKKAAKLNPIILEEKKPGIEKFWCEILEPNLLTKFGVKPVHSINEILYLMNKFPTNIKHFNIYEGRNLMAGTTIYINNNVAHAQYISGNENGRKNGFLDYLFSYLITNTFKDFKYFDFGICNENAGRDLNIGLLEWKEGFGARTIIHDFYEIKTENYQFLNTFCVN
ncbi:MAG: GNAT family N-acetyltransferase [Ignavibacteria bacterium]|nr:GNAT family N-acetyltransferase [Ignavibacteria bacterium]